MLQKKYWFAFVVSDEKKSSLLKEKRDVVMPVFHPVAIGTRMSLAELDMFIGSDNGVVIHVR